MSNTEKAKIVSETADKLGVDPLCKQTATMLAFLGGSPESITNILGIGLNQKLTTESEQKHPEKKKAKGYSKIEKAISEMLTENTGAHFLDSGGAYGRHWEKNRQIEDFRDKESLTVEVLKDGDTVFNLDVFHYLTSFLEIDETSKRLEKAFYKFAELPDNRDNGWYSIINEFTEKLVKGEYPRLGEWSSLWGENTYNRESILSQCLQYDLIGKGEDEYDCYMFLQIHNGCDVRGGYTKPRVFRLCERDYFAMADSNIDAQCKCVSISSDDCGYNWYDGRDDRDPKQQTLEGKDEPIITEHRKFPRFWEIVDKTDETPKQYTYDKALRCKLCGEFVTFSVALEW